MRIPSAKLVDTLEVRTYVLRAADLERCLNPALAFTEACSMAVRGEVEGVATPAGRVKYLRLLPEAERAIAAPMGGRDADTGKSTAFAVTHLGVYREAVREVTVREHLGFRYAEASGAIVGHVYAHCALR